MTDSHNRTTCEELLNTRQITKAKFWDSLQTLEAVFLDCVRNPLRSWMLFLVEKTHVLDLPGSEDRGSLSSERLRGKPAAASGGKNVLIKE